MRRRTLWIASLLALAAGAALVVAAKQERAPAASVRSAGTAIAARGTVERSVRLTGQTSARVFVNVVAPKQTGPDQNSDLILVKLANSGSIVKKGDLIAEIDAQALRDHVQDIDDTVRQAKADIVKRKAEQTAEWTTLQQTLRVAKADLEKARLDAKTTPLLTDIERELLQLSVEEADARYQQLQKDVALRKQSNDAELKILELTAERHERHHNRHLNDLTRFAMHAPIDGLAVMQTIWRDGDMGQVRQGDRVRPGQLFMKVVDPTSMQVEAFANQAESGDLRVGKKAEITLDAFPDAHFTGQVYSIGALATTSGWRQNYYIRRVPLRVSIDGQDARLIPDLSAAADVQLAVSGSSVTVPLAALHRRADGAMLYVKQDGRFVERMVTLGLSDTISVAVTSGLNAGDEVRLN
jgi:multidrug efflux pump subunit AcrA (membrane-fusion protein)